MLRREYVSLHFWVVVFGLDFSLFFSFFSHLLVHLLGIFPLLFYFISSSEKKLIIYHVMRKSDCI